MPLQIFPMPLQSTAAIVVVDDDGLIVCVSFVYYVYVGSEEERASGALEKTCESAQRGGEGGGRARLYPH